MKKNTRIGLIISDGIKIVGALIGLGGLLTVWQYRKDIIGFFKCLISFIEAHSVSVIIAIVALVVVAYCIWLYHTTEMNRRETEKLKWFDAERRITEYTGGIGLFYALCRFFNQAEEGLSWWAVTGVAGIGKTRLVIEALNSEELSGADVKRLRKPDDYKEEELKKTANEILEMRNFNNIIIAEDAQLYMDSIGILLERFANMSPSDIGSHRIRVLLLIRVGENEDLEIRYKQLVSKAREFVLLRHCYDHSKKELRIEKYREEDINKIVKSYVVNTQKKRREKAMTDTEIAVIQKKVVEVLKKEEMDSKHLRPLFAMFISDAILAGKDPMEWDRIRVLEYAVFEREEELLRTEAAHFQNTGNSYVFEKIRGIICLSIIRNGMNYSELQGIEGELTKELEMSNVYIKDFLKDLQLLGKDGIIRTDMPDILSEYYVLRTLVIEPDKKITEWIINRLCDSLEGTDVIRIKIRQDFNYLYDELEEKLNRFYKAFFEKCSSEKAFDIIDKLLFENDIHDSNAILLHWAIDNQIRNRVNEEMLSERLFNMINNSQDVEGKTEYFFELEHMWDKNEDNARVDIFYRRALVNMINADPKIDNKAEYFSKLESQKDMRKDDSDFLSVYLYGLHNIFNYATTIEEKRKYLSKLDSLQKDNNDNDKIALEYCTRLVSLIADDPIIENKRDYYCRLKSQMDNNKDNMRIGREFCAGLVNMISEYPKIENKVDYFLELESWEKKNKDNIEIVYLYCIGLNNMIIYAPTIEEKRGYLSKQECLAKDYYDNLKVVLMYLQGLVNMVNLSKDTEEKRWCWLELKRIFEDKEDNLEIALMYCQGLFYLRFLDSDFYDVYIGELYTLLSDEHILHYVAEKKPKIITYTRRELLEYEQKMGLSGLGVKIKRTPFK